MAVGSSNKNLAHDKSEFQWGPKKMDVAPGLASYKCMRYGGLWYYVNDCVFVNPNHVGKIMSLYQDHGERKTRVRWFLRAEEFIEEPPKANPKEVFMAMGRRKGVENVNLVDTILRKATVMCTALHKDNPLPSHYPDSIDHIFSKAYDTETKKLVDIQKINVARKPVVLSFFNKPEWIKALKREEVEPVDDDVDPSDEDVEEITGHEEHSNKRIRISLSSSNYSPSTVPESAT